MNTVSMNSEEANFLAIINRERAKVGAPPLTVSPYLTDAAKWLANDMATKNYISHTDSLGRNPFQRMAAFGYPNKSVRGENILAGQSTGQNAYDRWYTAPDPDENGVNTYAHRVNMLRPEFKEIGISMMYNPQSQYKYYWVTDFGKVTDPTIGQSSGQSMVGQSMAGQSMAGQSMAGQSMAGQSMADRYMANNQQIGVNQPINQPIPKPYYRNCQDASNFCRQAAELCSSVSSSADALRCNEATANCQKSGNLCRIEAETPLNPEKNMAEIGGFKSSWVIFLIFLILFIVLALYFFYKSMVYRF